MENEKDLPCTKVVPVLTIPGSIAVQQQIRKNHLNKVAQTLAHCRNRRVECEETSAERAGEANRLMAQLCETGDPRHKEAVVLFVIC